MTAPNNPAEDYLECPCCGCVGAESRDGWFIDGQPLICGCAGCVFCDSETEPYIIADDCECGANDAHNPDPGELIERARKLQAIWEQRWQENPNSATADAHTAAATTAILLKEIARLHSALEQQVARCRGQGSRRIVETMTRSNSFLPDHEKRIERLEKRVGQLESCAMVNEPIGPKPWQLNRTSPIANDPIGPPVVWASKEELRELYPHHPEPACICHKTVVGKSLCPVHGAHPAVEPAPRPECPPFTPDALKVFAEPENRETAPSPDGPTAAEVHAVMERARIGRATAMGANPNDPALKCRDWEAAIRADERRKLDGSMAAFKRERRELDDRDIQLHTANTKLEAAERESDDLRTKLGAAERENEAVKDVLIGADEDYGPSPETSPADVVKRLLAERDAAIRERDEWAEAIRAVSFGSIPSPQSAKAAIAELFEKYRSAIRERDEAKAKLAAAERTMEAADVALGAEGTVLERIAKAAKILRAFYDKDNQ